MKGSIAYIIVGLFMTIAGIIMTCERGDSCARYIIFGVVALFIGVVRLVSREKKK